MSYYIEEPKTESGKRILPMTNEVYNCCRWIVENRTPPRSEPMLGRRVGFQYLGKNGNPLIALHWQHYSKCMRKKYEASG